MSNRLPAWGGDALTLAALTGLGRYPRIVFTRDGAISIPPR
ncbi:hypothetical protein [Acrocarpospora corrugata]|nr:hypothetical protein [Acrocarpospora corrugata]